MFKSPALASLLFLLLLPLIQPPAPAHAAPSDPKPPVAPGVVTEVAPPFDVTLGRLELELQRTMEGLADQPEPPYFLSYEVLERREIELQALFGQLAESYDQRYRQLDIDLRVGDPQLDNTHPLRGGPLANLGEGGRSFIELPVEAGPSLRSILWYHTDRAYKRALERLTQVRTNVQVAVEREDPSADFAGAPAVQHSEHLADLRLDRQLWEQRLRRATAPFASIEHVYEARATLEAAVEHRWYVNSEGSQVQTSRLSYQLWLTAYTKADDGMELPRYQSYFAYDPEDLPDDAELAAAAEKMIGELQALRQAPVVEPFSGPAILSGSAAGVFFHEVFGHRVEGHRLKREDDSQTFKQKVGEQILPPAFDLHYDPTLDQLGDTDLAGFYRFDNEGVAARRVTVVDDGVLRGFLLSRSPIEGFPESNGHGRRAPGFQAVARQSNLLVEAEDGVAPDRLTQMLIERIRAEGKPFGLRFAEVQGGFTLTGRRIANAFNVLPTLVYKVYPDGHEELVRGVDLIGTPLAAFRNIVAADNQPGVFNGICGAESGGVPVAAISPGILVSTIEVQKQDKSQERLPILPAPSAADPEVSATETDGTPNKGELALPPAVVGDPIFEAMGTELSRSLRDLRLEQLQSPYYMAYRVDDYQGLRVTGHLGQLFGDLNDRGRRFSSEIRVGSPEFDNTNFFSLSSAAGLLGRSGSAILPLEDDEIELRRQMWLATDGAYKQAVETLARKQAALQNRTRSSNLLDFAPADLNFIVETRPGLEFDRKAAQDLVRTLSAEFLDMPGIENSSVRLDLDRSRSRYLNSGGGGFDQGATSISVVVTASTRAEDGRYLSDAFLLIARDWNELPAISELKQRVRQLGSRLLDLRTAPPAPRYNGPVLVEDQAAAELFLQLFAPQLPAFRRPVTDNPQLDQYFAAAQTPFMDRVGGRVLPRAFRLVDDPLRRSYEGLSLFGDARIDDEGVATSTTTLVERGILKHLLTDRTPVPVQTRSTGSRRGAGPLPSNLILSSEQPQDRDTLQRELLALAAERDLEYAIVIRRVDNPLVTPAPDQGSSTARMAQRIQGSGNVNVVEAYKLYPDGRTELLRNGQLTGINHNTFKEIVGAAGEPIAYSVPFLSPGAALRSSFGGAPGLPVVSAAVPRQLLFDDLSLKLPDSEIPRPPVLPHPLTELD